MNHRRNLVNNPNSKNLYEGLSTSKRTKRRSKNREEGGAGAGMLQRGAFSSNMGHFTKKYQDQPKKRKSKRQNEKPEQHDTEMEEPILDSQAEEPENEFMAKLSQLTGQFSNMDYMPKNKLLQKEYVKMRKEKEMEIQEVDEDAFEDSESPPQPQRKVVNQKNFLKNDDLSNFEIKKRVPDSNWDKRFNNLKNAQNNINRIPSSKKQAKMASPTGKTGRGTKKVKSSRGAAKTRLQESRNARKAGGVPTGGRKNKKGQSQMGAPKSKATKAIEKDMADDKDFKKFMAKYEGPDDDIDDIMNAADNLLGETLAGLTFDDNADINPYKRTKKAEKMKNYNKPDPSFDYLLNLNSNVDPLNPKRAGKTSQKGRPKKPSNSKQIPKQTSKRSNTGNKNPIKGRNAGSPYNTGALNKMKSPKSRVSATSKGVDKPRTAKNKFKNSNYSKTTDGTNYNKAKNLHAEKQPVDEPVSRTKTQTPSNIQTISAEFSARKLHSQTQEPSHNTQNLDKIDKLLLEESQKKTRSGKKRIQSGKVYQHAQKSKVINSPSKKYGSYSRGLNKFGLNKHSGRSPQRMTAVKNSYRMDLERRSNSMQQHKLKSGALRAKTNFRSPQIGTSSKKKASPAYDFTKKLDSRAANRGGSSARGHRNHIKSSSKKGRVPSYMGKRPRGYVGQKTFLGRMQILDQSMPVEDPRREDYQMKSLNDLDLDYEHGLTSEINKPNSNGSSSLFKNTQIMSSMEFGSLVKNAQSIQNLKTETNSTLYNSLNEQQLTKQKQLFKEKFSPSANNYGKKFKTKKLNQKNKKENSRLYNSHMSYANSINKKLGDVGSLKNIKKEIEIENKKNGTVVIKPQFFSNFQIVNIDSMIPIMNSSNTNLVVNGDTHNVNNVNNNAGAQLNSYAEIQPQTNSNPTNSKIASKKKKDSKTKQKKVKNNLVISASVPNSAINTKVKNFRGKQTLVDHKKKNTTLGHNLQQTKAETKKSKKNEKHLQSSKIPVMSKSSSLELDFKEEEILVDTHSKSDNSMILGSQRSPSNKKLRNKSNRRWKGKSNSISKNRNDIFGRSYNGFSSLEKRNRSFDNRVDLDLRNIEFEVSYDFTKEIEKKAKNIRRSHNVDVEAIAKRSKTPNNIGENNVRGLKERKYSSPVNHYQRFKKNKNKANKKDTHEILGDLDISSVKQSKFESSTQGQSKLQQKQRKNYLSQNKSEGKINHSKKSSYAKKFQTKKQIQKATSMVNSNSDSLEANLKMKKLTPLVTHERNMNQVISQSKKIRSKASESNESYSQNYSKSKQRHNSSHYLKESQPYAFSSEDEGIFQSPTQNMSHIYPVEESEIDQTISSMIFEVDLSSFTQNNTLNKSADLMNLSKKQGKKGRRGTTKSKRRIQKRKDQVFNQQQSLRSLKPNLKRRPSSTMTNFSVISVKSERSPKGFSTRKKAKNLPKFNKIYYTDKLIDALASRDKQNPFYEHFLQSAQSLVYIKNTEMASEDDIIGKKVYLPPLRKEGMKTLIFDLDETLIHCNEDENVPSDMKVPIKFTGGDAILAGLNIRPYARQALDTLSKHYEIVVFTASHSCYANEVLNILDPEHKYISYRLYRDSCMKTEDGIFIKDLRVFGNRKLSNILLVDNVFYSYGFQLFNGVPILPFYDNKQDTELKGLVDFLVAIKGVRDVRDATKRFFMSRIFKKYCAKPDTLMKMLMKERTRIVQY